MIVASSEANTPRQARAVRASIGLEGDPIVVKTTAPRKTRLRAVYKRIPDSIVCQCSSSNDHARARINLVVSPFELSELSASVIRRLPLIAWWLPEDL
jgi:hypothetical protein